MPKAVELMPDAIDYGNAPEFVATGVCRVYYLSHHMIRVVFCRTHMDDDGHMRLRVTGHMDADVAQLPEIAGLLGEGLARLQEAGEVRPRAVARAVN